MSSDSEHSDASDDVDGLAEEQDALQADYQSLVQRARAIGFRQDEAAVLADIALAKVREAVQKRDLTGEPMTAAQVVQAVQQHVKKELVDMELGELDDDGDDDDETRQPDNAMSIVETELAGPPKKLIVFSDDGLDAFFGPDRDPYGLKGDGPQPPPLGLLQGRSTDLLTAMCQRVDLAVELAKHLGPRDLLNLYSVSRAFNASLNGHLLSSVRQIIAYAAPDAGHVFNFRLYRRILVPDPVGRSWAAVHQGRDHNESSSGSDQLSASNQVRAIPGIRFLQLVLLRDRCCRDILAIMARHGHGTPPGTHGALLRMWMLMEVATSRQRLCVMRAQAFWSDQDLYNAQLFIIKLTMLFNDPIYGPGTPDLIHVLLGQRGLYCLWQLLTRRRLTSMHELLQEKTRHDLAPPPQDEDSNDFMYGIPWPKIGLGHLEGWGRGHTHLMRPDELVPYEATYRGLHLDQHIQHMAMWGFLDWKTGDNLVPTDDEMYISDHEHGLAHMDTATMWQRKHVLKKRWASLTSEQQDHLAHHDQDDCLRTLAWASASIGTSEAEDEDEWSDWSSDDDDEDMNMDEYDNDHGIDLYSPCKDDDGNMDECDDDDGLEPLSPRLDSDLRRGFIVRRPQLYRHGYGPRLCVPPVADERAWTAFCNTVQCGLGPLVSPDERLRALAWHSSNDVDDEVVQDWEDEFFALRERTAAAATHEVEADEAEDEAQDALPPFADSTSTLVHNGDYHDDDAPAHGEMQDDADSNVQFDNDAPAHGEMQDDADLASFVDSFFNSVINATGQGHM
ncbi:hypothetical protein CDD82_2636 [Ophiocordyceps australis]|uniref:Uncharacterized protein n=1 Tax=Ophiocordyceps australis TaxID=1399860 RepID=A0A2C5ZWB9_9HYPO|nr:hypothetical protein CDD82_2636 [Ophiocordyceps australis]